MQNQNLYQSPSPVRTNRHRMPLILAIIFGVLTIFLIAATVYLWLQYSEQKNHVDSISATRVAEATKAQAEKLELEFAQREKQPMRQFTGPEDYGRLVFMYPKTWSLYIVPSLPYYAYLHPKYVRSDSNNRFALRLMIEAKSYESVLGAYKDRVARKGLKSSTVEIGSGNDRTVATRFDGPLTDKIIGSAIVFKIRDKTVTIQTDIEDFRSDFNNLIKTISFIK